MSPSILIIAAMVSLATTTPIEINPIIVNPIRVNPIAVNPIEVEPITINPMQVKLININPIKTTLIEITPVKVSPIGVNPVTSDPIIVTPTVINPIKPAPTPCNILQITPSKPGGRITFYNKPKNHIEPRSYNTLHPRDATGTFGMKWALALICTGVGLTAIGTGYFMYMKAQRRKMESGKVYEESEFGMRDVVVGAGMVAGGAGGAGRHYALPVYTLGP